MRTPDIDHLRQLIEDTLSELGIPNADWSCVRGPSVEQGRCGARVPRSEVLAIWLADCNQLEFRGENGSLLKTVSLENAELVGAA
jgi:hypothetical protein